MQRAKVSSTLAQNAQIMSYPEIFKPARWGILYLSPRSSCKYIRSRPLTFKHLQSHKTRHSIHWNSFLQIWGRHGLLHYYVTLCRWVEYTPTFHRIVLSPLIARGDTAPLSAVPWLRRLFAGLLPRRPKLEPRCGICGGKNCSGTDLCPSASVFLCQYHSIVATHSFIHLPPTLCNLRNWQRGLTTHRTKRYSLTLRQTGQQDGCIQETPCWCFKIQFLRRQ